MATQNVALWKRQDLLAIFGKKIWKKIQLQWDTLETFMADQTPLVIDLWNIFW